MAEVNGTQEKCCLDAFFAGEALQLSGRIAGLALNGFGLNPSAVTAFHLQDAPLGCITKTSE